MGFVRDLVNIGPYRGFTVTAFLEDPAMQGTPKPLN